jgi:WD40 repeat protein
LTSVGHHLYLPTLGCDDSSMLPLRWLGRIALWLIAGLGTFIVLGSAFAGQRQPAWIRRSIPNTARATLALDPGGKVLAAASHDALHLYDIATGRRLCSVKISKSNHEICRFLAFSPDGKRLVSAHMGTSIDEPETTIRLWDVTGEGQLRKIATPLARQRSRWDAPDAVYHAAFSPNSKVLIAGTRDGTIYEWDALTGRELLRFPGGAAASFAPDGTLTTVRQDGLIRRWQGAAARPLGADGEPKDYMYVSGVAFSPDGKKVALWDWYTLRIKDVATENRLAMLNFPHTVVAAGFSSDSRILAVASGYPGIWLFSAATGRNCGWLKADSPMAFANGGRTAAWAGSDDVRIVDFPTAVAGAGPPPVAPHSDPPDSAMQAELIARRASYVLDLRGHTPQELNDQITRSDFPPAPRVDLEVRLRNRGTKPVTISAYDNPEIILVGTGAVNLRFIGPSFPQQRLDHVTLAPGQDCSIPVRNLNFSHEAASYWLLPGDYQAYAHYHIFISPPGSGAARAVADGSVTVWSDPVKLQVLDKRP